MGELNDINKAGNLEGLSVSGNNGSKPFHTENTVYEDKAYPVIGRRLTSNAGTADYDYNELSVNFSQGGSMSNANDLIGVNSEYPHQAKEGGFIYPHLHWWQISSNDIIFELDYRIQNNNGAKTTPWTRMTASAVNDSAFTYVSGILNQISSFKDISGNDYIDMSGHNISSTIQFKMTRTDSTGGVVGVTFFDFHFEIDDLGSRDLFVK